ncbi:MAG: glycerol-3-phosphate 1-O-acyltransferase PlsY [Tenuifilaceae bacterium]|jgi:glycerol-3-phosphate acyltransferase PlsY|nr:glycerol-3-phosphate 1-O-acyltransferase PlsY [Tenuifilaceae bacterium]
MEWILKFLTIVFAYLLGSIPTSVWVGKIFFNIDVRDHGSGNAGATNTFRVMGAKAGLFVFFVDGLKGYAAVRLLYLTDFYTPETGYFINFQLMLGMAAMIGHIFPIFASFRGGKGVATLAGVVLALHPMATLFTLGVFIITLLLTKYVSLSSMIAAFTFPFILIFAFSFTTPSLIIFSMVIAVLLLFTHQKNIERLLKGEEKRFKIKKKQ